MKYLKAILQGLIGIQKPESTVERMNSTADGFYDLYCDALTYHGRYYMAKIIKGAHGGEIHPEPEVVVMITHLLTTAPYQENAIFN